jgi:hypothetical protein
MKKITKSDLKGLIESFSVYSENSMKKVIGGYNGDDTGFDEWTRKAWYEDGSGSSAYGGGALSNGSTGGGEVFISLCSGYGSSYGIDWWQSNMNSFGYFGYFGTSSNCYYINGNYNGYYITGNNNERIDCAFQCLSILNPAYTAEQYQQGYEDWISQQNQSLPEEKKLKESDYREQGLFAADFETVFSKLAPGGKYSTDIASTGFTSGMAAADVGGHCVILTAKASNDNYYIGYDPQNDNQPVMYSASEIKQVYIM